MAYHLQVNDKFIYANFTNTAIYFDFRGMQAYICNYRDHWFTIRRIANQWFNLNSLLSGPELITNTYLAMFLAQLQQEGNLILSYGLMKKIFS